MTVVDSPETLLARYHGFQECLLTDVRWDRFGTAIHLDFAYIWADGPQRDQLLPEPRTVTLTLDGVQEFSVKNRLSSAVLSHPERLDWGLTEISQVRMGHPAGRGGSGAGSDGTADHLIIEWESARRIDAVFAQMRVVDEQAPGVRPRR